MTNDRVPADQHRADVAALLAGLNKPVSGREPRPRRESVNLDDALGRVLAGDVRSTVDLPSFRNSQMDGYAVRAADTASAAAAPVVLPVVAEIPAAPGVPAALPPGSAARIMTGAPLPAGADAVVPVENTGTGRFTQVRPGEPLPAKVEIRTTATAGDYVREQGSDVAHGELILSAGTVLGPQHIAGMAAVGCVQAEVLARPRVAVLSTGSELAAPGSELAPGQVFESNSVALAAAVRAAGGEVVVRAHVPDDSAALAAALADAVSVADLILTSGGVSMGAYEVVRDALADDVSFRSVAMQPGGPQGFGRVHGVPILTFPGNPVSAQVSFVVLARDAIRRAAGLAVPTRTRAVVVSPEHGSSPAGKRQFLRGVQKAAGEVAILGGPGSHLVATMARADVLVDVPAATTAWSAGDSFEVWEL